MVHKLEMTVLTDNLADEPLAAEWGLSILIKADELPVRAERAPPGH